MMDRILHGLYHHREMVDEEIICTGSEILWLMRHPLADGAHWHKGGHFQTEDHSRPAGATAFKLVTAEQGRPLTYLSARGLITYKRDKILSVLRLAVTYTGADRARKLHTRWGRAELWYQDHKDGIVGLLVAALVAMVVSLLVNPPAAVVSTPRASCVRSRKNWLRCASPDKDVAIAEGSRGGRCQDGRRRRCCIRPRQAE